MVIKICKNANSYLKYAWKCRDIEVEDTCGPGSSNVCTISIKKKILYFLIAHLKIWKTNWHLSANFQRVSISVSFFYVTKYLTESLKKYVMLYGTFPLISRSNIDLEPFRCGNYSQTMKEKTTFNKHLKKIFKHTIYALISTLLLLIYVKHLHKLLFKSCKNHYIELVCWLSNDIHANYLHSALNRAIKL